MKKRALPHIWPRFFSFLRIALPFNLTQTDIAPFLTTPNSWCYCDFSPFHFYWATVFARMPDQISVSEFLSETTEDYNSPTTSSFTTRLQSCRNTVNVLEEVRPLCNCYTREHRLVLLCMTQITVPVNGGSTFFIHISVLQPLNSPWLSVSLLKLRFVPVRLLVVR